MNILSDRVIYGADNHVDVMLELCGLFFHLKSSPSYFFLKCAKEDFEVDAYLDIFENIRSEFGDELLADTENLLEISRMLILAIISEMVKTKPTRFDKSTIKKAQAIKRRLGKWEEVELVVAYARVTIEKKLLKSMAGYI